MDFFGTAKTKKQKIAQIAKLKSNPELIAAIEHVVKTASDADPIFFALSKIKNSVIDDMGLMSSPEWGEPKLITGHKDAWTATDEDHEKYLAECQVRETAAGYKPRHPFSDVYIEKQYDVSKSRVALVKLFSEIVGWNYDDVPFKMHAPLIETLLKLPTMEV